MRRWWEKDESQQSGWFEELPRPPEWTRDALCGQIGGNWWHPEKGESTATAKRFCWSCPVQADCLEYAVEAREAFGVWGGFSEQERNESEAGVMAAEVARLRVEQAARVVRLNRVPARHQRNAVTRERLAAAEAVAA